jgi:chromosomal replication initiator protein
LAAREVEDIFADILDRAKALDPANVRRWFDNLTVSHLSGGSLEIGCPDEATVQFLRDNCKKSFTQAAQQITGHLITVDFNVVSRDEPGRRSDRRLSGLKLHPDYTFDNFVVGPSNRLGHASCVAVSRSLGDTYNPLFLYGSSGLGKTHLLHAVCCEVRQKCDRVVIQFLSCEDFVNRFIRAIETGNLAGFQSQFRTVDALVIDDVQFLREREQSHLHLKSVLSADLTGAWSPGLIRRAMKQGLQLYKRKHIFAV